MRKILIVAFAIAIVGLGFGAHAQVPFVVVSFDDYGAQWARDCPAVQGPDTLTVWACNFNMWMTAIEYQIDYPPALTFLGDNLEPCDLWMGNSLSGITISYPCTGNAFGPFVTQRIIVWWNCDDCVGFEQNAVVVLPHPTSGKVRAVEWQTYRIVEGVGMTSLVCPWPIPTRETTWGELKALYDD